MTRVRIRNHDPLKFPTNLLVLFALGQGKTLRIVGAVDPRAWWVWVEK